MENMETSTGMEIAVDLYALRETIKAELIASWEPEMKKARIEAKRKEGRLLARSADHRHFQGRVSAFCDVASYFIIKDRLDIAQHILEHFMIDRKKAAAALEADKRVKNLTLAYLDKAGAWGKLDVPEVIL